MDERLQQEHREKERRCCRALQERRLLDVNSWVEHGIAEPTEHRRDHADGPEDSPDQHSVRGSQHHPCQACDSETVRVAGQLRQSGERRQQQRHSRRMEQQEVLVGKQAVDQPSSRA